jgi:hypothetical protein
MKADLVSHFHEDHQVRILLFEFSPLLFQLGEFDFIITLGFGAFLSGDRGFLGLVILRVVVVQVCMMMR